MKEKRVPVDCASVLETLDSRWAETPLSSPSGEAQAVAEHLDRCPECRGAADDLRRMDECLRTGFRELETIVGAPSRERIEETIRRVREASPDAELIRKIRRPLRIILWGTFYGFTLVACSLLAWALYKALKNP